MASKFDHERHNRRDKVSRVPTHASGGSDLTPSKYKLQGLDLVLNPAWTREREREEKARFLQKAEQEMRRMKLKLHGYAFSFSMRKVDFANANNLGLRGASMTFESIRVDAEERLQIVKQRLRSKIVCTIERDSNGRSIERVMTLSLKEDLSQFFEFPEK